jgi:cobalt/nickel transport protein
MKVTTKLWIGLAVLIIISPIGLVLPERFRAGVAWGEWGIDEIKKLVGYIPRGLERLAGIWNAPLADYAFKGWEEKGIGSLSVAYIFSAAVGIIVTAFIVILIGKLLVRNRR